MNAKLFIGPMSKNIVDTVIKYCEEKGKTMGFIPSRRQIEFDGGYVNNWTTKEFANYVRSKTNKVILQRDHGGPLQGDDVDNGIQSFTDDAKSFSLIHIDPWKKVQQLEMAANETAHYIEYCDFINENCRYEVGTEEAIRVYSPRDLDEFLKTLEKKLGPLFKKIEYGVIQFGTAIQETKNVGFFDKERALEMIKICKSFGLKTKEHNGDYLSNEEIKSRFELGLDSINIAPEFGVLETKCILNEIENQNLFDRFFEVCYDSGKWKKWVSKDFKLNKDNKDVIITLSGHYTFTDDRVKEIKKQLPNIDDKICKTIYEKLEELHCAIV